MTDVTRILSQIEHGDPSATDRLILLVYSELRKLAAAWLAREKPGQTLQATALVHESFLRLFEKDPGQHWESRAHFFAAAAEAMRRILVDNALRKNRPKHGGDRRRLSLDTDLAKPPPDQQILALNDALERLSEVDAVSADVVKLKYFAGLSIAEIAELLQISTRTADRRWAYARAWLHQELCGE